MPCSSSFSKSHFNSALLHSRASPCPQVLPNLFLPSHWPLSPLIRAIHLSAQCTKDDSQQGTLVNLSIWTRLSLKATIIVVSSIDRVKERIKPVFPDPWQPLIDDHRQDWPVFLLHPLNPESHTCQASPVSLSCSLANTARFLFFPQMESPGCSRSKKLKQSSCPNVLYIGTTGICHHALPFEELWIKVWNRPACVSVGTTHWLPWWQLPVSCCRWGRELWGPLLFFPARLFLSVWSSEHQRVIVSLALLGSLSWSYHSFPGLLYSPFWWVAHHTEVSYIYFHGQL